MKKQTRIKIRNLRRDVLNWLLLAALKTDAIRGARVLIID